MNKFKIYLLYIRKTINYIENFKVSAKTKKIIKYYLKNLLGVLK